MNGHESVAFSTYEKVAESNRIEGITRAPTPEEIKEHERFVTIEKLCIGDFERFLRIFEPNARLRVRPGQDVRVGSHPPPFGGEHIREQLGALLADVNAERIDPWAAHIQYENLHPFTDGNGRSGRMLWYWMLLGNPLANKGFLHAFYYQTLEASHRGSWT